MKKSIINSVIILLSILFTLFSFVPTFYEYINRGKTPSDRYFVLEHNYNFDYNFYLSRIRQGMDGKNLVTEKYYNKPHKPSLFQIVYLYLGKAGAIFNLTPTAVYQVSRFVFGMLLLFLISKYGSLYFQGKTLIMFTLLAFTAGSFPILLKAGENFRFGTYMGWWSVIDSLQRITIMPHILIGQAGLVILVSGFSTATGISAKKAVILGVTGLITGIIFPPTVIIVYVYLMILGIFNLLDILSHKGIAGEKKVIIFKLIGDFGLKSIIFVLLTVPSLIYLQFAFKEDPWKALALFDIEHRFLMPYGEYALALGSILILGVVGFIWAFIKGLRKFYSPASWILVIVVLFAVFENVPEQSPLRFTEGVVHVPLAIFGTYFVAEIWKTKKMRIITGAISGGIIISGLAVMASMVLWLTDQAYSKRFGTWKVPLGAQHAYPVRDFMDGIFYLRDNTRTDEVVLGYISTGNYIPAYAGNYVYLGHANTPQENKKEVIAQGFFKGEMKKEEAFKFLRGERISLVFFGPQERELTDISDLKSVYDFLTPVYTNNQVTIYRII